MTTSDSLTITITGISGWLASHIAIKLLAAGHTVQGTVRDCGRIDAVARAIEVHASTDRLSIVDAELTSDRNWDDAISGTDYVMHVASPIATRMPANPSDMIGPATEGTRRVMYAAARAGVQRVVMTSSTAAVCYGHAPPVGTAAQPYSESEWTDPDHPECTAYVVSKTLAERTAWEIANEAGVELTTINPCVILGPVLDADYGVSNEIVKRMLDGSLPGIANIGFPIVDVRDVSAAHVSAMTETSAGGQRYLVAGRFMWCWEVADILREAFPRYRRKIPLRRLPNWLVRVGSVFDPAVRSVIRELDRERHIDASKARQQLAWKPRPEADTIRDTARSLIDHGIA